MSSAIDGPILVHYYYKRCPSCWDLWERHQISEGFRLWIRPGHRVLLAKVKCPKRQKKSKQWLKGRQKTSQGKVGRVP